MGEEQLLHFGDVVPAAAVQCSADER